MIHCGPAMNPFTLSLACLIYKFATSAGYDYRTLDVACRQMKMSNCELEEYWTRVCQQEAESSFKYHAEKMTWNEAFKACKSEGKALAMPKKKEEQMMAKEIVKPFGSKFLGLNDVWIGLEDIHDNDTFFWDDGSPLFLTDWLDEQPNHLLKDREQNCGTIHVSNFFDGWKAHPCDEKFDFLCQD